ncbi:MAG TPA: hypothetical protein VIR38_13540 [Thalassobaculum sp.]
MQRVANRGMNWVGTLSYLLGAAVLVPSLIVLAITLFAVARMLF